MRNACWDNEVFAEDKEACQEMLRVLPEDDGLTVLDMVVQSSKRNIYGRSVRPDALCTLGNGKKCNIEVQRADDDDHFRRVCFNAASITVKEGSRISTLMDCFTQEDVVDSKEFPAVSKRVRELKTTEGGASAVCDIRAGCP